jgi:hypothetical protein
MRIFRSLNKYLAKLIFWHPKPPPAGESPDREQDKPGEQRVFSRHWVSFPVIVSRPGRQDADNREKAVLRDISGGGALFISTNPENYYPGQLLKISIMLDGTEDVKARIQTEATVIRIHKEEDPEKKHAAIAVQFDRSFEFERIDNRDSGPIG